MTYDQPSDDHIGTEEEFKRALDSLLSTARANGVDPVGGYVHQSDDGPNLEVVIVRLDDNDEQE